MLTVIPRIPTIPTQLLFLHSRIPKQAGNDHQVIPTKLPPPSHSHVPTPLRGVGNRCGNRVGTGVAERPSRCPATGNGTSTAYPTATPLPSNPFTIHTALLSSNLQPRR